MVRIWSIKILAARPAMTTSGRNTERYAPVEAGKIVTVDQTSCSMPMTSPHGSRPVLGPGRHRHVRPRYPCIALIVVIPGVRLRRQILFSEPAHVSACPLFPRLAIQQSQRTPDDVAGFLAFAAVSLDDAEIFQACG